MEDADWTSIFENEYKVKLLKMFIREQQRRQDLQEGHWQEEVRPSESPLFDEEAEDNDKDWRDPCEDQDEEDEEQYMEEEHWEATDDSTKNPEEDDAIVFCLEFVKRQCRH